MANVYTNYKAVLTTNALTTLYTVPSEKTAIIKSIRVANIDAQNDCKISIFLVDSDSVSYNLQTDRTVEKLSTEELLKAPLVLLESEILKATAATADRLHVVASYMENS